MEIDEIKESAKEADIGSGGPVPGTKIKGKPGRKPGQKNKPKEQEEPKVETSKPKEPEVPTSEILKPGLHLISEGAVRWARHKDAGMRPDELETIAQLMGKLLDKYAPQAFSKYGLEITCGVIIGQYGLRVVQLRKAVLEHEEKLKVSRPPSPNSEENLIKEKPQFRGPEIVN